MTRTTVCRATLCRKLDRFFILRYRTFDNLIKLLPSKICTLAFYKTAVNFVPPLNPKLRLNYLPLPPCSSSKECSLVFPLYFSLAREKSGYAMLIQTFAHLKKVLEWQNNNVKRKQKRKRKTMRESVSQLSDNVQNIQRYCKWWSMEHLDVIDSIINWYQIPRINEFLWRRIKLSKLTWQSPFIVLRTTKINSK